jgi:uncharacterized membrane protein (DUF2068 family)
LSILTRSERKHGSAPTTILVLIGAVKLLKAGSLVALGFVSLHLLHRDLVDTATHWIVDIRLNPDSWVMNWLLLKLSLVTPHKMRIFTSLIFAYAAMDVLEGTGLVLEKWWAEYLTLIVTGSFLPWEIYEMVRHFTWPKVFVTLLNALVLIYLFVYLHKQGRLRRPRPGVSR